MERTKICRCANSNGKLMNWLSDTIDEVKQMEFGNISDFGVSNLNRRMDLLKRSIGSVRDECNIDTLHQEDIADNISRGIPSMIKMTDTYEFDVEKSMMIRNLRTIREQVIIKFEECSR